MILEEAYCGQIVTFAGMKVPAGWLEISGQSLKISEYEELYSALGTTYGGDGKTTFNLPYRSPAENLFYMIKTKKPDLSSPNGVLGEIICLASNTVPEDWLECNGQMLQISSYVDLFAVIGKTFGGDGSQTFALPSFVPYASSGTKYAICSNGSFSDGGARLGDIGVLEYCFEKAIPPGNSWVKTGDEYLKVSEYQALFDTMGYKFGRLGGGDFFKLPPAGELDKHVPRIICTSGIFVTPGG